MNPGPELKFRRAFQSDIPFLIDAIVSAEKSGTEIFSYSNIFEMPEQDARKIFADIIAEDVRGQDLCISDYFLAEIDGKVAGCIASWIEGEGGQPSGVMKGTLLNYFFPKANMLKAQAKKKVLDALHFEAVKGTLVIENCFTLPEFRGLGILTRLMQEQTRLFLESKSGLKNSQMRVLKTNRSALEIYLKMGYKIIEEQHCPDPVILKWLPSDTQYILERQLR